MTASALTRPAPVPVEERAISSRETGRPRLWTQDHLIVGLLVGLVMLLWLPRTQGPIDLRYDAGVYYLLGMALAEGKGYRLLNEPSEIWAVQYPPLLPLLVAAHRLVVGTDDVLVVGRWLRLTSFLIASGYAVAVYLLARRYLPTGYALLSAILGSGHLMTVFLSDFVFAELPFAFVSVLFLLVSAQTPTRGTCALAAVLGAAAYLLRTAGIALLGAWIAESVLRRRFREAAVRACLAAVPVVAWQAYVVGVTGSAEYRQPAYEYQRAAYQYYNVSYAENLSLVDPFQTELGHVTPSILTHRLVTNLLVLPDSIGEAVSSPIGLWSWMLDTARRTLRVESMPDWLATVPIRVLGIASLVGILLLARRREWLISTYVGLTALLVCVTPWPSQFTRYLMPVTPFLAVALFTLMRAPKDGGAFACPSLKWFLATVRIGAILAILTVLVFTIGRMYRNGHHPATWSVSSGPQADYRLFYYDESWQAFDALLSQLRADADATAIVATSAPHYVHLKTGLRAVMPPYEADADEAQRLLDGVPVTYLVIDDLEFLDVSRRYGQPAVARHPENWTLVYGTEGAGSRIYRRK